MTQTNSMTRAAFVLVLMILSAQIKIALGPVPFTLQTAVCLLAGGLLGARWGAATMAVYLGLGLMGLPIFSAGGGPGYLFSPTFGYLAGFVPAAAIAGMLRTRLDTWTGRFLVIATALSIIYLFGVTYLYFILRIVQETAMTYAQAWSVGAAPFIVQDATSGLLALVLLARLNGLFADRIISHEERD